jgi:hypothetical protein
MEDTEDPYYIRRRELPEEKQTDDLYFDINSTIHHYNIDYDRNINNDVTHNLKCTIRYLNKLLYSNKYNDHIMWVMIRGMCDIDSLQIFIPQLYKETVQIDISNNIWPIHLYNNGILYIKKGIQEIIQWNYFFITNRIYNYNYIISDRLYIYFLQLLDKYCELFNVTYTKCTVDEWLQNNN